MVQKAVEVSANSLADHSDESENEDAADKSPATTSSRALKEQGQHPTNSGSKQSARGTGKDFTRKDSSNVDSESRRDNDYRKENDYRREEPREQRVNRKLKENRERVGRRGDRREREGVPVREREGPRAAVAK